MRRGGERRGHERDAEGALLTTSGTYIERLAQWAAKLDAAAIPGEVTHAATRAIVDTTGVLLAGARRPLSVSISRMMADECREGHATMIPGGPCRQPAGAALANGVAAHLLDFDDTSYDGILHASCVVLPAVLACCEEGDGSTSDLLAAFVAGSEVTYVLGRALTDIFWKGWWTTATLGSIGAAAGASRALGLDAATTGHAIAIASSLTFGMRTILGTDANPIGAGMAAQAGVRAALLARSGSKGNLATIEHPIGLATVFNRGELDAPKFDALGIRYSLTESSLAFKPYPACSGAQAASQAVGEMMKKAGIGNADIKSVTCRVAPLVAENLRYPDPANLTQAQFSLPFAVACFLAHGEFSVRQLKLSILHSNELRGAMAKVVMERAEGLGGPDGADKYPEAAEITMELKNGKRLTHRVLAAHGMPVDPMTDAELREKFLGCARETISDSCANALYAKLNDLAAGARARSLFAGTRSELAEMKA
jgi:2-methylcitrate dehydratase PrpD